MNKQVCILKLIFTQKFHFSYPQSAKPLGSSDNTSERVLGIWVSVWVGRSVAAVKLPQAMLPTA